LTNVGQLVEKVPHAHPRDYSLSIGTDQLLLAFKVLFDDCVQKNAHIFLLDCQRGHNLRLCALSQRSHHVQSVLILLAGVHLAAGLASKELLWRITHVCGRSLGLDLHPHLLVEVFLFLRRCLLDHHIGKVLELESRLLLL